MIDSLDRVIIWQQHELALRDSMHAIDKLEWQDYTNRLVEWGDRGWKQANSWWAKHESAFWAVLGAIAVALASNM